MNKSGDDVRKLLKGIIKGWSGKSRELYNMLARLDDVLDFYIERGGYYEEIIDLLKDMDEFSTEVRDDFYHLKLLVTKLIMDISNKDGKS